MPSNLSRSETSQSIEMMSRAPPTTWPTSTLETLTVAVFLGLSFWTRSFIGPTLAKNFSFSVAIPIETS